MASGGNCGEGGLAGLWECEMIDSGDGVGQFASQDLSWDDQIHIAYYDGGSGNLKYAYYAGIGGNCGAGNAWHCSTLDSTNGSDVRVYASLKAPQFSGDHVHIAYYDRTNENLKYYDSSGWKLVVDSMGTSTNPMGISMDINKDSYPVIAYQKIASEFSPPELRLARPN